jgi:hypothetical protein
MAQFCRFGGTFFVSYPDILEQQRQHKKKRRKRRDDWQPGLPDGFFSDQNSQFGDILEDLGMENVVIFSGHLEYFTTIVYILCAFGNFVVILYIFPPLWYIVQSKIWQPCVAAIFQVHFKIRLHSR